MAMFSPAPKFCIQPYFGQIFQFLSVNEDLVRFLFFSYVSETLISLQWTNDFDNNTLVKLSASSKIVPSLYHTDWIKNVGAQKCLSPLLLLFYVQNDCSNKLKEILPETASLMPF